MRGFVALLLLLCIGTGAALEWVRASHPRGPQLMDSRRIAWQNHRAGPNRLKRSDAPREGSLAERIAILRKRIKDYRFWIGRHFEYGFLRFDRVDCRGAVLRIEDNRVVARISTRHPVAAPWHFCAQSDGVEYYCRIEEVNAGTIVGVILERQPAGETPRAGVVLLRPMYLRPPPGPRAGLAALDMELRRYAYVLNQARTMPPRPPPGPNVKGRVLDVAGSNVTISVGSRSKVAVGTEFKLSRGSQFVGFLKITRVTENTATGEFDERFAGKGAPPRAGDRAYTRRSSYPY